MIVYEEREHEKKYVYDEEKKWDFLASDNDVDDNLIDGGRSEQFMILRVNESQQYEVVTILRSQLAENIVTIQIRLTDIFFYCTRPKCIFCNNNHLL